MKKCILEELRKQYPVGNRVELIKMEDVQAPPIGTKGTVLGVDDIGSIMVAWDNGSSLNVVYSVDKVRMLETVKTICYGREVIWDSREKAIMFFLECMASSEGAERERYLNILVKLKSGEKVCVDD
ncbi:MAG TPA: DUF4314 domain-containing protein [Firmicutes bacterium]|nr:DUF4314 domain-containing protein [Bacillota bacterium]HAX00288.1 DUF4314 domain-containing protein [Bacillota bacterium]